MTYKKEDRSFKQTEAEDLDSSEAINAPMHHKKRKKVAEDETENKAAQSGAEGIQYESLSSDVTKSLGDADSFHYIGSASDELIHTDQFPDSSRGMQLHDASTQQGFQTGHPHTFEKKKIGPMDADDLSEEKDHDALPYKNSKAIQKKQKEVETERKNQAEREYKADIIGQTGEIDEQEHDSVAIPFARKKAGSDADREFSNDESVREFIVTDDQRAFATERSLASIADTSISHQESQTDESVFQIATYRASQKGRLKATSRKTSGIEEDNQKSGRQNRAEERSGSKAEGTFDEHKNSESSDRQRFFNDELLRSELTADEQRIFTSDRVGMAEARATWQESESDEVDFSSENLCAVSKSLSRNAVRNIHEKKSEKKDETRKSEAVQGMSQTDFNSDTVSFVKNTNPPDVSFSASTRGQLKADSPLQDESLRGELMADEQRIFTSDRVGVVEARVTWQGSKNDEEDFSSENLCAVSKKLSRNAERSMHERKSKKEEVRNSEAARSMPQTDSSSDVVGFEENADIQDTSFDVSIHGQRKADEQRMFEKKKEEPLVSSRQNYDSDPENNSTEFGIFQKAQVRQKRAMIRRKDAASFSDIDRTRTSQQKPLNDQLGNESENQKQRIGRNIFHSGHYAEQSMDQDLFADSEGSEGENRQQPGYEYRYVNRKVKKNTYRSFTGDVPDKNGVEATGVDDHVARKKRNFFLIDSENDGMRDSGSVMKQSSSHSNYSQLIKKPFESGKRTFEAEGQVFSKSFSFTREMSSGKEADQEIYSKSSGMVKTLMIKSATEAAKLPIRVAKGITNAVLTVMGAIATGGLSLLLGIVACILSIAVFVVCIVVAACGILWIGQHQGYIQVGDFPSLIDFLDIYNWLLEIFRTMGEMFY